MLEKVEHLSCVDGRMLHRGHRASTKNCTCWIIVTTADISSVVAVCQVLC